jgi:hypothetical protein
MSSLRLFACLVLALVPAATAAAAGTRDTVTYRRLKAYLDSVRAIDTHDHLWPFDKLPGYQETQYGRGMNLYGLWRNSYYAWNHPLTPWTPGMKFDDWAGVRRRRVRLFLAPGSTAHRFGRAAGRSVPPTGLPPCFPKPESRSGVHIERASAASTSADRTMFVAP